MKNLLFLALICICSVTCSKSPEDIQEDLCKGISCQNGGTCVNGDCNCPVNYTGPDCSQQKTPTNLVMSSITIATTPATDGGAGWDLTSGPDIFVVVTDANGTELYSTRSNFKQNSFSAAWSTNWIVPNPSGIYTFSVYDYDDNLSADDFMGGIQTAMYTSTNGFPNLLNINCGNCVVSFAASLSYTW